MWYTWTTLLLVSCALVGAEHDETTTAAAASTRAPARTLDRKAAELAWKTWLQSPESGNPNAPPRRITTKSLFITPFVCPKGQRLDQNGCVQPVSVEKSEHERILLEQLTALFNNPTPNTGTGDVLYDYELDEEPGPLQLSIPIGLDPLAAPLHAQEPSAQAQNLQPNYVKLDKKDVNGVDKNDAGIEAELELMKVQNSLNPPNKTSTDGSDILNHNVLTNTYHYPDKPKRDSPTLNSSEIEIASTTDAGQKELVYGHVNVDPVVYPTENVTTELEGTEVVKSNLSGVHDNETSLMETSETNTSTTVENTEHHNVTSDSTSQTLNKDGEQSKLNPENDYSDIGEAIKLISRYADVTTDDNFTKDQKKNPMKEDSILGTRTKLQYRRKKPALQNLMSDPAPASPELTKKETAPMRYANNAVYYRYPWQNQDAPTPPPDYPFRHLQDYWPGRNHVGGVYNTHGNPRRHHHSYPHNYRLHGYPNPGYIVGQPAYPDQLKGYIRRTAQHRSSPRSHNQDLYSLLGLRHWFSSEGTSKR